MYTVHFSVFDVRCALYSVHCIISLTELNKENSKKRIYNLDMAGQLGGLETHTYKEILNFLSRKIVDYA